jgi:hypothetical protein
MRILAKILRSLEWMWRKCSGIFTLFFAVISMAQFFGLVTEGWSIRLLIVCVVSLCMMSWAAKTFIKGAVKEAMNEEDVDWG